jgi:serine/threonine-protein kinase
MNRIEVSPFDWEPGDEVTFDSLCPGSMSKWLLGSIADRQGLKSKTPATHKRFHYLNTGDKLINLIVILNSAPGNQVMIGQTISQYKILDKLGEGGMGVVYKAHDTKLDRLVALKFLPHHLVANEAEQARFLQEARAASALNHPNVCTIYDIKEEGDKQFIVMEFVDGTTIKEKVPIQKLQDALGYALQIGDALHEAHGKGIVHRDIKCENIMVNPKNQVKVMDFGLAKLKGSLKLTKTSSTVGTLAYMAPEQIQGGEVDARSDIFSFGVVLFEMLTGGMPFRGDHEAAILYSIVNEEPESLQKRRPDISGEVDRIIRRALEKDPEDRYQHIDDMVSELRRIRKQSTRVSRSVVREEPSGTSAPIVSQSGDLSRPGSEDGNSPPPPNPVKRYLAPLMVGLVLVGGAVAYFSFFGKRQSIDTIAVLPFTNAASDSSTEYLSDGITESLINTLSQLSNLSVKSRSSVFHYKGKDIDPQKAGKELGVKAVLTGRVSQRGDDLQISAELVDVSNDNQLWGGQYNKKVVDLLAVQEAISKEISQNLSLRLGGEDEKKLAKHTTENTEAYQLYLKGRFHWNKRKADDLRQAIDYFNQAIEKDPGYALAYAGLGSAYAIYPEYSGLPAREYIPKTEAATNKALELDATLAEPHAALGLTKYAHQWDWAGAETELKRAIELDPNYPTSHHWYSICLRQQGKVDESWSEIKRAQELDPLSPVINLNVGEVLLLKHQEDKAIEQYEKVLEVDPNFPGAHLDLAAAYAKQQKFSDAIGELQKARQILGPNNPYGLGLSGYVYARSGNKEEAQKILNRLISFSTQGLRLSTETALVYAALNDKDKAFEWLEKGIDEQNTGIGYLNILPVWEPLRTDHRFAALLKRIHLTN